MNFKITFFLFLFLSFSISVFSQTESAQSLDEKVTELTNLLYTVENFQQRLGTALDNNEIFQAHQKEEKFYLDLVELLRADALGSYATIIKDAFISEMTEPQMDSLIVALQSPYGDVIKKAFVMDNTLVTPALDLYVDTILEEALRKRKGRDSLLYVTEFEVDLSKLMDGEYTNTLTSDMVVQVTRSGNQQREILNGTQLNYDVKWNSNNQYSIVNSKDNPCTFIKEDIIATVYEIEGNEFRFIVQFPDGHYEKSVLIKTSYTSYDQEIQTFQIGLNEKYQHPVTSPLSAAQILAFKELGGHPFYPLSKAYRVTADIELFDQFEDINMSTSSGKEATYQKYGRATFKLNGASHELTIFRSVELNDDGTQSNDLFIPFRDLTSGKETYGGGRYIDMKIPDEGKAFIIDFNKAYHPYCAYTDGYSCPIPPSENTLTTAVNAGIQLLKLD
ncbi:MAG: DUF1684 domain-containing protein [Bacteroidota bacterium]